MPFGAAAQVDSTLQSAAGLFTNTSAGAGGLSTSFFFLIGERSWLSPCSVAPRYVVPPCAHCTTAMCGVGN